MEQIKIKRGEHVQIVLANGKSREIPPRPESKYPAIEYEWPVILDGRNCLLIATETLHKKLIPFCVGDEIYIELRIIEDGKIMWVVEHRGHRNIEPSKAVEPQKSYEDVQLEKEMMRQRENYERQGDIHTQSALKMAIEYLNHSPSINPVDRGLITETACWFLNQIEGGLRQFQMDEKARNA